jgi:hypothetical protein
VLLGSSTSNTTTRLRFCPLANVKESYASRATILLEDLALLTCRRVAKHLIVEVEHLQLLFCAVLNAPRSTTPLLRLLRITLPLPLHRAAVLLGLTFGLGLCERLILLLRLAVDLRTVLTIHAKCGTHSHAIGASAYTKGEREGPFEGCTLDGLVDALRRRPASAPCAMVAQPNSRVERAWATLAEPHLRLGRRRFLCQLGRQLAIRSQSHHSPLLKLLVRHRAFRCGSSAVEQRLGDDLGREECT